MALNRKSLGFLLSRCLNRKSLGFLLSRCLNRKSLGFLLKRPQPEAQGFHLTIMVMMD